jgi:alpha-beta hydrolase superfamily lysophospholipase
MGRQHPALQAAASKYDALAKEVAEEIASRATKQNLGNIQVRTMLMKAITDLHDKANPTAPPIIIC